jgi:hypothetical protein
MECKGGRNPNTLYRVSIDHFLELLLFIPASIPFCFTNLFFSFFESSSYGYELRVFMS